MPLPPPPAAALTISGKPICLATTASSSSRRPRSLPGTKGTPRFFTVSRAVILSPIASMASGEGPMKVIPASAQAAANSARSERKP